MFKDGLQPLDYVYGAVAVVLVLSGLFWLSQYEPPSKEQVSNVQQAEILSPPPREPVPQQPRQVANSRSANMGEAPRTIARVFECERDGQRIISDQPCGEDATIRDIASPNRMQAQDTRSLYAPPPRSVQVERARALQNGYAAAQRSQICREIDEERDRINARMRKRFTAREGEYFRERLRELSEERWGPGCGRNNEVR
jgi:hypothetical protein